MLMKSSKSSRRVFAPSGRNSLIISSMSASVNLRRNSISALRRSFSSIKPSPREYDDKMTQQLSHRDSPFPSNLRKTSSHSSSESSSYVTIFNKKAPEGIELAHTRLQPSTANGSSDYYQLNCRIDDEESL